MTLSPPSSRPSFGRGFFFAALAIGLGAIFTLLMSTYQSNLRAGADFVIDCEIDAHEAFLGTRGHPPDADERDQITDACIESYSDRSER